MLLITVTDENNNNNNNNRFEIKIKFAMLKFNFSYIFQIYTSPLLWPENRNIRHLYLFLFFSIITYMLIISAFDLMTENGYWNNWWYFLNWIIIYLCYHLFFLLVHRFDITTEKIEGLRRQRPSSYVNLDALVHLDYKCRIYASAILFIAAVRYWGTIRFDKCFRNVDYTLRYVAKPLLNLLVPLITLLWGMSVAFKVIFISLTEMGTSFRDSLVATITLPFGYMTGIVDYNFIVRTGFMGNYWFTSTSFIISAVDSCEISVLR